MHCNMLQSKVCTLWYEKKYWRTKISYLYTSFWQIIWHTVLPNPGWVCILIFARGSVQAIASALVLVFYLDYTFGQTFNSFVITMWKAKTFLLNILLLVVRLPSLHLCAARHKFLSQFSGQGWNRRLCDSMEHSVLQLSNCFFAFQVEHILYDIMKHMTIEYYGAVLWSWVSQIYLRVLRKKPIE